MDTVMGRLIGSRVKLVREKRELTQDELGEFLGTNGRQIWRYETEKTNPNSNVVSQLAHYLQTSSGYLLGETDDDTPELKNEDLSAEERALIVAVRKRPGILRLVMGFLKELSQ